jgi:hypothetical protein
MRRRQFLERKQPPVSAALAVDPPKKTAGTIYAKFSEQNGFLYAGNIFLALSMSQGLFIA